MSINLHILMRLQTLVIRKTKAICNGGRYQNSTKEYKF